MRRAAKVDTAHPEIVEGLRAIGCDVQSLASVGNGCPDLLCHFRGAYSLIEVKSPGEQLNPIQKRWHAQWKGPAHVVWSLQEAIAVVTHQAKKICSHDRVHGMGGAA